MNLEQSHSGRVLSKDRACPEIDVTFDTKSPVTVSKKSIDNLTDSNSSNATRGICTVRVIFAICKGKDLKDEVKRCKSPSPGGGVKYQFYFSTDDSKCSGPGLKSKNYKYYITDVELGNPFEAKDQVFINDRVSIIDDQLPDNATIKGKIKYYYHS